MIIFNWKSSNLKHWLYALPIMVPILLISLIFITTKQPISSNSQPRTQESLYRQSQAINSRSETTDTNEGPRENIASVSRSDVAQVTDSDTAHDIHQKLAVTLITELELLTDTKNRNTIRARLTATANKFYLLKRAIQTHQIDSVSFSTLPPEYDQRIEALSELWNNNPDLAHEADNIYSELGLLDSEHVPYLLRNWLISNIHS